MNLFRTDQVAVVLMMDLASSEKIGWVPLSQIARKHGYSILYLKKIIRPLVGAGLVVSREGISGGYRIAKNAKDITLWDIFCAATEKLEDVSGKFLKRSVCPLDSGCKAKKAHQAIQNMLKRSFSSVSLQSVI